MNKTPPPPREKIRGDLRLIAAMIESGARVLDVGAGDGSLLGYLVHYKDVDGRGIEIDRERVTNCVQQGLSVIQGDAESDLANYPSGSFDYVVLSQTVQALRDVPGILEEMLRIGRHAAVSFPNFGHWRVRLNLIARGRMPVTPNLPHEWYNTPNIHLCTVVDFLTLCQSMGIVVDKAMAVNESGGAYRFRRFGWATNLLAEKAVVLLSRG